MEVYNLLSSVAVRIPQEVTVQLAADVKQYVAALETLNDMRKNALLCDTCIVGSDGYSLYAHACILAAVCPALRSQLARKHQANSTNIRISTDSIESGMWEKVLRLIYCGEVQLPVYDLIMFLDITHELDIQSVQVLYVPVKPMKKGCNLCFIATNDDNPVCENHSKVEGNFAYSNTSASSDNSSQEQVIIIEKDDNNESKTDELVDMHSHVEALQCFEGADGTAVCRDSLTSLADLSKGIDHNLQPTSVSSPLVDPVATVVKSEHDVELENQDITSATFISSSGNKHNKTQDGSCLLTCKTEPMDSQADNSEWCNVDSAICAVQEADVLAEAFVSSGLMASTDVFSRISDGHSEADNRRPYYTTSTDALTTPRGRRREKRFMCDLCRHSFGQMSDLQRHHRVHTGERPYSCNLCGVRFTQSTSLKRHLRLLHGVTLSNYVISRVDVTGVKS